jgi:hypothetical protein
MLRRNLIYTGVTRSKQLVVLVGQRKALAIAVKNSQAQRGWSKLNQMAMWRTRGHSALAFRARSERLNDLCVQEIVRQEPGRPSNGDAWRCGFRSPSGIVD